MASSTVFQARNSRSAAIHSRSSPHADKQGSCLVRPAYLRQLTICAKRILLLNS